MPTCLCIVMLLETALCNNAPCLVVLLVAPCLVAVLVFHDIVKNNSYISDFSNRVYKLKARLEK